MEAEINTLRQQEDEHRQKGEWTKLEKVKDEKSELRRKEDRLMEKENQLMAKELHLRELVAKESSGTVVPCTEGLF